VARTPARENGKLELGKVLPASNLVFEPPCQWMVVWHTKNFYFTLSDPLFRLLLYRHGFDTKFLSY